MDDKKLEKFKNLRKWSIGKAAQWLIEHVKEVGININGFEHEITDYFINHVLKEHGNSEKEKARGQVAIKEDDFEKISSIVENPDHAMIGAKREGKDVLYYVKKMNDGTTLYVEDVLNSNQNKSLRGRTLFKRINDINKRKLINIVSMNKATDISEAKIVSPVGTGSNPGYDRPEKSKVVADPTQPSGQLSTTNIPQYPPNVNDKKMKE